MRHCPEDSNVSEGPQTDLPFDWTITSSDASVNACHGSSLILGSFAAINAIAGVLSILFGCRIVVNKLTFGGIARLTQTIPESLSTFSIPELMLFFTVRPGLSWLFLLFSQFGEIDRGLDSMKPYKKVPSAERTQRGEMWTSASLT
jgi:hypothetical protein